jgi:CRP-like cAMP-binding protein
VGQSGKNIGCDKCSSQAMSIFCQLDRGPLAEISSHKVMNTYKKGHVIFYQGNPPFGLYCISRGKIKITKVGTDGKESIVRIASVGDVLGHRSLFSNENYNATATAMEDTSVCFIDKKFIYKIVNEQPSIALNIIQKLSREMGSAESKSASMFQKNVRERLAELLLTLSSSYGVKEQGRVRLDIKLTREELASMIGTASETVIRFITEFKEEGLIEQEGKTIFIIDNDGLLELANINF